MLNEFLRQILPPFLIPPLRRLKSVGTRKNESNKRLAQEIASLKRRFDLRNANAAEGEIVLRDILSLAIHPDSLLAFEYFCFRSPEMVAELDAFIARIRPCHRLLDVGALHGIFSLVFVAGRNDASAVAVDASPRAFSKLLYNVHKNKFRTVTAVECALSDKM